MTSNFPVGKATDFAIRGKGHEMEKNNQHKSATKRNEIKYARLLRTGMILFKVQVAADFLVRSIDFHNIGLGWFRDFLVGTVWLHLFLCLHEYKSSALESKNSSQALD